MSDQPAQPEPPAAPAPVGASDAGPGPDAEVTLREMTRDNFEAVLDLKVKPGQENYVAPNVWSIAEAHFAPEAWYRAIYADETPVGFVMLSDKPDEHEYFLWRLMVDGRYQGRGYGRRALELVVDYVRHRPEAHELLTSYVPGEDGPERFYRAFGFEPTGEVLEGELVMRLALPPDDRLSIANSGDAAP